MGIRVTDIVAPRETPSAGQPTLSTRTRPPRLKRRPTGAPPPLPHHLQRTGVGWLLILASVLAATMVIFQGGVQGPAIAARVIDDGIVEWLSELSFPGLHKAARIVSYAASWWSIQIGLWAIYVAQFVFRRWRHLLITTIVVQSAQIVAEAVYANTLQPRPFGVAITGTWGGWTMPSQQMFPVVGSAMLVLYTLVPEGRPRNIGKWIAAGIVLVISLARLHLAVDTPSGIVVGSVIAVAIGLAGFRLFAPSDLFPITYRKGRAAHLDVGGERGAAIRHALHDQLGLAVTEVIPVGLSGSAGSTPLRIRIEGSEPRYLFGKLYSKTHLRSDRWYKLGRELLYGRLEDEKPFNTVRRLVQQEDYALRVMQDAGLPTARPYGFVELTPEREYLLVTEFFDGAVELGDATVDEAIIDEGLTIVRLLWDNGLAHRDVKPANLMVHDGHMVVIDVAFAEMRPTPWRQAVDLANMMLCLALRSDAQTVYERALRQFTVDEICEAFAAARGLALPSQLRRALRAEGRDLHSEFLSLLPEAPAHIRIQRWSVRRAVLTGGLAVLVLVLGTNYYEIFGNRNAARTPLNINRIDCRRMEPLWLEAQAVPSASFVPCVRTLPVGWSFHGASVNQGRAEIVLDHDRAGPNALTITLTERCDTSGTVIVDSDVPGSTRRISAAGSATLLDRLVFETFTGGCTAMRLRSTSASTSVALDLLNEMREVVGFVPRATLADELDRRSNGALHLDHHA